MKFLSKTLAVIFLFTAILSGLVLSAKAAPVDYLSDRNPGVETSTGWSGPAFSCSTLEKHTGASSAFVTAVDSDTIQPNGYLLMSARVFAYQSLSPSTNYILSFWVKSQAASFNATSLITFGTTSINVFSVKNRTSLSAAEFTLVQQQITTPADIKATIDGFNAFIFDIYTSSDAYFDDFSLVEGTLPATPTPTPSPTPTATPIPTATPSPSPSPTPYISIDKIEFSSRVISINVGTTRTLSPVFTPSNATNKTLKWISTDEAVATVNSAGLVTAKAKGVAFILAIAGGEKAAHCQVNVVQPVKSIKIVKSNLSILKGKSIKLNYSISPANASNKSVVWKSSNSGVAKVSANGTVKAIKKGIAYISVTSTDGKFSSKCKVTVIS